MFGAERLYIKCAIPGRSYRSGRSGNCRSNVRACTL